MLTEKGNLISTGASIIRATSNGDVDAVRALLAEGADVDQRGRGGHTALMVAAIFGHVEIAHLLLSAHANVNLQDNLGLTARDWADRRGSWEVAQLLSNGSPAEIELSQESTPGKPSQPKVGQRRNPAAEPPTTSQLGILTRKEEQGLAEPGAVANWSTTGAVRREAEGATRKSEPNLSTSEADPEIASEPDALRFMKFHKQIMAAQERLKAEQARTDARLSEQETVATWSPAEATGREVETNREASLIETRDIEYQHDVPSPVDNQITRDEPERREKEVRPTATESARIAATIEHLRLEESSYHESDVPVQSNWEAEAGVDQTLDHNKDDITLERLAAEIPTNPAMVQPRISEPSDAPPGKRCPDCNAVYDNPLVKYCAYDAAKLISSDDPMFSYSANKDRSRQTLWALVAMVTVLGVSLGYLINNYRSRSGFSSTPIAASSAPISDLSNSTTATHTEPPEVTRKDSPLISGELSGMEVDVPVPEYPAQARAEGVSGAVMVRVEVNQKGRVVLARSSRGDWRLRAAAVKAAQKATFSPEKLAVRGKAVSGTITYNFLAPTESPTASGSQAPEQTDSATPSDSSPTIGSAGTNGGGDYPVVEGPLVGAESNLPRPAYPESAKSRGISGPITVVVRVNRAGRVISWRTLDGDSQLRAAALKAAKRATFSPVKLPGKGDVVGSITYNFK